MAEFKVGDLVRMVNTPDIALVVAVTEIERLVELENNAEWRMVPGVIIKWIDDGDCDDFDRNQWWQLEVINENR